VIRVHHTVASVGTLNQQQQQQQQRKSSQSVQFKPFYEKAQSWTYLREDMLATRNARPKLRYRHLRPLVRRNAQTQVRAYLPIRGTAD
jgi:hypothetical protein